MQSDFLVKRLQPNQVANLLKNESDKLKTLVIDVRDDVLFKFFYQIKTSPSQDYIGGHIKGCINITCDKFEDDDDIRETIHTYLKGKERIIVHCMKSVQRGVFSANRLANVVSKEEMEFKPDVFILDGGFQKFVSLYGYDSDICEDVDKKLWSLL